MLKQSRSIMSLQSGKGDFPVYRGVSRQYGNGLGSIFKAALRTVIPILKPVAKASLKSVKKVAKDQGVQALKDIVGGENVKKVLKQRGKTALKSFGQSTINQLAINSTQNAKSLSLNLDTELLRGALKAEQKSLILLNVWYLKKIYLTKNDSTRFLRLHKNGIGYGIHSTHHDYHARHSVE